jgi:hypothetical protein
MVMAIGDAIQVGVAAKLKNWRGENDFDVNAVPDDWIVAGSPVIETGDVRGLSGIYATAIQLPSGSDTVALRTKENAVPVPDGTGDITIAAYFGAYTRNRTGLSTMRPSYTLRLLESDLTEISTNLTALGSASYQAFWTFTDTSTIASDNFTTATAYVEVLMKLNAGSGSGEHDWYVIDSPFLCWQADGTAADGLKTLTSTPTSVQCNPITSRKRVRDMTQSAYTYGGDGGRQLWRAELGFDFLEEADYAYLKHCYAVNTGRSGYRNANGDRLAPQPIVIMPHIFDPPGSGTAGVTEEARPPIIIGKMQDPAMTFQEFIGFGYSGQLIIEEERGD